jgi:hypothetical protein
MGVFSALLMVEAGVTDLRVNEGKDAREVIGIAGTKDPKCSCIHIAGHVIFSGNWVTFVGH